MPPIVFNSTYCSLASRAAKIAEHKTHLSAQEALEAAELARAKSDIAQLLDDIGLASNPVTTRLQRSAVVKRDTLGGTLFGLKLAVSFLRDSEMRWEESYLVPRVGMSGFKRN